MDQRVNPIFVFTILSGLFVLSQFYRVSNAVIAPDLIRDLDLNAEMFGMLGGAFFYAFTILQIPMGPLLDRMGPRPILTVSSFVGASGAFLFAFGNSFLAVFLGRILIGAGMAPMLMGSFKTFTLRYPPEQFATLMGMIYSVGTLGNILAASPLAFLTSTIGWRNTFLLTGMITVLLGVMVFRVLKEEENQQLPSTSKEASSIGILKSIRLMIGSLSFWQFGAVAFFRYGIFVSLQGLWLGPYLIHIKGFSPVQAGNLLILMSIGAILGSPIGGHLSDRYFRSRKKVAFTALFLYTISLLPLTGIWKIDHPLLFASIFFSLGFFNGMAMLIYAHAKESYPIAISGTVMTYVNFFTMAGAGVFMTLLGKVIESFPKVGGSYPIGAYHLCFLICFLSMGASLIFYGFAKEKPSI
jgi:predicted MFS family arabinose efflux permease